MHSNRTTRRRAVLLLTGLLLAAPFQGAIPVRAQNKTVHKKKAAVAPMTLVVNTDQPTYKAADTIKFTLTAKNTTKQDTPVGFNSGQRYDFTLYRGKNAKGEKVWQWAKGKMFNMMLRSILLKPDQPLEFTETYHPGSEEMPVLTPGVYTIVATLQGTYRTTPPIVLPSTSKTFQVN